jgi:hypothetical protein
MLKQRGQQSILGLNPLFARLFKSALAAATFGGHTVS